MILFTHLWLEANIAFIILDYYVMCRITPYII